MAVFEYEPGRHFRQIDQLRQTLRLASGADNIIRGDSFQRGVSMLSAFRTYCEASEIGEVVAVATSAVRDAANGAGFVAAAKERASIDLDILAGEVEARYGVLGVANSHAFRDALVLDVGGGSAQLSFMEGRSFVEGRSWPVGGVRMTEAFLKSDPPRGQELQALREHLHTVVDGRLSGLPQGLPMVGMGGTIRNLARLHQARNNYPVSLLHGYVLTYDDVCELADELSAKTYAQRKSISGLNSERADVIVAAATVVRTFMEMARTERLVVSSHGLREGLLYHRMWPAESGHLAPDVRAFTIDNVARRYYDRPKHNAQVCKLSLQLFDGLAPWHQFTGFERELLEAAAKIHDIGMAVDYFEHHHHGRFLVSASPLPGFNHREQALIALLVGCHRKGKPRIGKFSALLQPGDAERLAKLAGMLRLAEYLERTKAQRVQGLQCHLGAGYLQVEVAASGDVSVELQAANQRSDLLAKTFGVQVEVVLGGPAIS